MRGSCCSWRSWWTVLVLLLFTPTLGWAVEWTLKSEEDASAPAGQSCFTLLNAKEIPAGASAEVRLATARVKVNAEWKTPADVVAQLGKTIGVPVVWTFDVGKHKEWGDSDEQRFGGTIRDVSARGYLDYLFFDRDFGQKFFWSISKGRLVVSKGISAEQMERKVYDVTKFLTPRKQGLGSNADMDDLVKVIKRVVTPEGWSEVDDSGTISSMELSGAQVLIVRNGREAQEQVAAMLAVFRQMLDRKQPGMCRLLNESVSKRFYKAMDQKVTLDMEEVPPDPYYYCSKPHPTETLGKKKVQINRAIASIEEQISMPLAIDRKIFEELSHSDGLPGYRCKDLSLRTVRDELFGKIDFVFVPACDMILLMGREKAKCWTDTAIFDVTDLLTSSEYPGYDYESFIKMIKETVAYETWTDVGGVGTITPLALHGRAFVIVHQTEKVIKKMEWLLEGLRVIQKGKVTHYPPVPKEDRELLKKLKKKIDWCVEQGTTIDGFLTELNRKHGINCWVDQMAIERWGDGLTLDSPLKTPLYVKDCSIEMALDLLLNPMGLEWCVREGRLVVSYWKAMSSHTLFTEIYEVSDLTTRFDTQGNRYCDFDSIIDDSMLETSLVDLIRCIISPYNWSEVAGAGTIGKFCFGDRNVLVICQMKREHKEIADFFAELRATLPKDPAKRVASVRPCPFFPWFPRCGQGILKDPPEEKLPENLPPAYPCLSRSLVEANNAFALKLYAQLAKAQDKKRGDGSAVKSFSFSPYSVASLMQAITAGTRGQTEKELRQALCLAPLPGDGLHYEHGSLFAAQVCDPFWYYLPETSEDASKDTIAQVTSKDLERVPRSLQPDIATRLWIQKSGKPSIQPKFQKFLDTCYFFGVEEVDFRSRDDSTKRINQWVDKKSKQAFSEMVSPGDITASTRLVGVDGVFYQGCWKAPFKKSDTRLKPFYDSGGKLLGNVPMMSRESKGCLFGKLGDVSVFRTCLFGDNVFVALLPPPGKEGFEKLEASLSLNFLRRCIRSVRWNGWGLVELPKLDLKSDFSLIEPMKQLGVKSLFDRTSADLSDMVSPKSDLKKQRLAMDLLCHKTWLYIDEGEILDERVAKQVNQQSEGETPPQEVPAFIANRPFVFLVIDGETSSILMFGRYMGPEQGKNKEQATVATKP
ncbi:MAG: serpin family protein [Planctomycetia bacterium]